MDIDNFGRMVYTIYSDISDKIYQRLFMPKGNRQIKSLYF